MSEATHNLRNYIEKELKFYTELPILLATLFSLLSFSIHVIMATLNAQGIGFDLLSTLIQSLYLSMGFALIGFLTGALFGRTLKTARLVEIKEKRNKKQKQLEEKISARLEELERTQKENGG